MGTEGSKSSGNGDNEVELRRKNILKHIIKYFYYRSFQQPRRQRSATSLLSTHPILAVTQKWEIQQFVLIIETIKYDRVNLLIFNWHQLKTSVANLIFSKTWEV